MKQLIISILLCFLLPASAQQFTVFHDTIHIDGRLLRNTTKNGVSLRAAESRDGLYLLMESRGNNELLFVERNSHKVSNIRLPDLATGFTEFQNIFVRHDSLLLKTNAFHDDDVSFYEWARKEHDKDDMKAVLNYTLETHTGQWKPIKTANDHIYEDSQYKVCYWERGEWGTYLLFQERKSHKRHLYMGGGRLIKVDDSYYLVSQYSISKIENPRQGKVYRGKKYYKLDKEDYSMPQTILQLPIPERGVIELTKEYLQNDPRTYICTAFTHDGTLYCIMKSPAGMYVASYQNGVLHKEMDLGCNYSINRWKGIELRENNRPDHQAFLHCKDEQTDNPAILTVEGTKVHLWYLSIEN